MVDDNYTVKRIPILKVEHEDGSSEQGILFSFGDDAEVLHRCLDKGRKDLGYFVQQTAVQFAKMVAYNWNGKKPVTKVKVDGETYSNLPCNTVAVGSIPYFGYGFKALPLAGEGNTHVRIFNMGVARFILHGHGIWNGTFQNGDSNYPYMKDLLGNQVEIEMEKPQYFNNTGEPRGLHKKVKISFAKDINLICRT